MDLDKLEQELQQELANFDSDIASKVFTFSSPLLRHHRSLFLETPKQKADGPSIKITDSGNIIRSPTKGGGKKELKTEDKENSAVQLDLALCDDDDDDNLRNEEKMLTKTSRAMMEKSGEFNASLKRTKDLVDKQAVLLRDNAELRATVAALQAQVDQGVRSQQQKQQQHLLKQGGEEQNKYPKATVQPEPEEIYQMDELAEAATAALTMQRALAQRLEQSESRQEEAIAALHQNDEYWRERIEAETKRAEAYKVAYESLREVLTMPKGQ
jgi:hypothetical protein